MWGPNNNVVSVNLPRLSLPLLRQGLAVPFNTQHKVQVFLGVLFLQKCSEEGGAVGGLEELVEGGVPMARLHRAGQQVGVIAAQATPQHVARSCADARKITRFINFVKSDNR